MEIRPLREDDDRSSFRSGDPDLDRFFARYAGQNQFRLHIGTTYVAADGKRILGFSTVAPSHIEAEDLPESIRRKFPGYPLPILRLARMAVDEAAQGRGVGSGLLRFVFVLARKMSSEYGCVGVVVDAKPNAADFYARYGFANLPVIEGESTSRPPSSPMFLSIHEIASAGGADSS